MLIFINVGFELVRVVWMPLLEVAIMTDLRLNGWRLCFVWLEWTDARGFSHAHIFLLRATGTEIFLWALWKNKAAYFLRTLKQYLVRKTRDNSTETCGLFILSKRDVAGLGFRDRAFRVRGTVGQRVASLIKYSVAINSKLPSSWQTLNKNLISYDRSI